MNPTITATARAIRSIIPTTAMNRFIGAKVHTIIAPITMKIMAMTTPITVSNISLMLSSCVLMKGEIEKLYQFFEFSIENHFLLHQIGPARKSLEEHKKHAKNHRVEPVFQPIYKGGV